MSGNTVDSVGVQDVGDKRQTDEIALPMEAVDATGDAAESAVETVTDAIDAHDTVVQQTGDIMQVADRVESGTADPNKTAEQGEISKAVDSATETATGPCDSCKDKCTCMNQCGGGLTAVSGILEIFGTMMEVIVAPVAGPCYFFWIHKFLVAFAIIFFFVNLGILLDTMANTSVTDIELKHETSINYPDLYVCIPAYAWFYGFKCCGDTCGRSTANGGVAAADACKEGGYLALALEGSSSGCEMGIFPNYDLGKSAATSCPYTAYRGQGPLTDAEWASYKTYKMEYAGATSFPEKTFTWSQDPNGWAAGLENKMPTYTPSKNAKVTLNAGGTGTFVAEETVTDGTTTVACTITHVNSATELIVRDCTCPNNDCDQGFSVGNTITGGTSSASATVASSDPPKGYRYRSTTYKPVCYYFKNTGNAVATYGAAQNFASMAFSATMTNNLLAVPPALETYVMEAGKVPYEGTAASTTGGILATKVNMPGYGNQGLATMHYDKIKDETKGETEFTYLWQVTQTSAPIHQQNIIGDAGGTGSTAYTFTNPLNSADTITEGRSHMDGLLWGAVSFTITDFIVREVTIRDYTVAEVWAGIGGLWSGSLMILMIFFSTSDVTNSKHRFFRVFNFLCPSKRDEWLEQAETESGMKEEEIEQEEEDEAKFIERYQRLVGPDGQLRQRVPDQM